MRAVVQRVIQAEVVVAGSIVAHIARGFVVLLGVAAEDGDKEVSYVADRILKLRIFADPQGKMNLDLKAAGGELLVVSQFTLLADIDAGRRPSFAAAARPEKASELYRKFLSLCRNADVRVEEGQFGAMMSVKLTNDGPVTIIVDTGK